MSLWDDFIGSYEGDQATALHNLKEDHYSSTSFEDFSNLDVNSVSDSMSADDLTSSSSYAGYTLSDLNERAQAVFNSCDNSTDRIGQLKSQYPPQMQDAIEYTINDMVARGAINSIYQLRENSLGAFQAYFNSFKQPSADFPLCSHPFMQGASANLLSNANTFIQKYRYSFALSFYVKFGFTDEAYNAQNMSVTIKDLSDKVIYSGSPDPNGRVTFNYDYLKDGTSGSLPTSFSGTVTPKFNGGTGTASASDLIFGFDTTPDITVDTSTMPIGSHGDIVPDNNSVSIDSVNSPLVVVGIISSGDATILANAGFHTLADIRAAGGLANLDPPLTGFSSSTIASTLDAHARLEIVTLIQPVSTSHSYYVSQAFIKAGCLSANDIANLPLADVVNISKTWQGPPTFTELSSSPTNYGELNAVKLYYKAKVQASLAADYVHGYITLGSAVMEDTNLGQLGTSSSNYLAKLTDKCSCTDCETAVSPQAYLMELTSFIGNVIKKSVSSVDTFIDMGFLEANLYQAFDQLAGHCSDVDALICQQRLAVEILRAYNTAKYQYALTTPIQAYATTVYNFILGQLGTSLKEVQSYKNQTPDAVKGFADRLGLYILPKTDTNYTDDRAAFFEFLLPDITNSSAADDLLEKLYGLRTTSSYQLSQGLVYSSNSSGTGNAGLIKRWRLNNVQFLKYTDEDGKLYLQITNTGGATGKTVINLYNAPAPFLPDNLVATGSLDGSSSPSSLEGTVTMGEPTSGNLQYSGINGYFDISGVGAGQTYSDVYVKPYSTLEARMLRFQYANYSETDFPKTIVTGDVVTQVAIDPDIIGPSDIYYPWDASKNGVFALWSARYSELNTLAGDGGQLDTQINKATSQSYDFASTEVDGIASDLKSNIYVSEVAANAVILIDSEDVQHPITFDAGHEEPKDLFYNFSTDKLLVSFQGTTNKIGAFSIDTSAYTAATDWELENFSISNYAGAIANRVRQDSNGDLILANSADSAWMKYYLPQNILLSPSDQNVELLNAGKPYLSQAGTVFIPDTGAGLVYEIEPATGKLVKTIGYDFKSQNLSYLKCDETSGTTATDSSGHGAYGTLSDTDPTHISFSTSPAPDYGVHIPADLYPSYNAFYLGLHDTGISYNQSERTFEIWFKCDDITPSRIQVLYREGDTIDGFIVYIQNGYLYCGSISGGNITFLQTNDIQSQTWYQLVCVLNCTDAANKYFQAFLNASSFGKILADEVADAPSTPSLGGIGSNASLDINGNQISTGDDCQFVGLFHNYRLWNRYFSETEVSDLYNSFNNPGLALINPVAVCTNVNGDIFIADAGTYYIHVFDSAGNYLRKFGGKNSGSSFVKGLFAAIADITLADDGFIYVLDGSLNVVQVFDQSGAYQSAFGAGVTQTASPSGDYTAIDAAGNNLYILTNQSGATVYQTDNKGNIINSLPIPGAASPLDITAMKDSSFTAAYVDTTNSKSYLYSYNFTNGASSAFSWYLGEYYIKTGGNLIQYSPADIHGLVSVDGRNFYVTDLNSQVELTSYKSRIIKVGRPMVNAVSNIKAVAIDRLNRIYIASNTSVSRCSSEGVLDDKFELTVSDLTGLTVDQFNQIYLTSSITTPNAQTNIIVYNDSAVLISNGDSTISNLVTVRSTAIDPNGKLLVSGMTATDNEVVRIDVFKNFGSVLNYVFSQQSISASFITYTTMWWDAQQGKDIQGSLDKLYLTTSAFRYLEDFRASAFISAATADWQYVKDILANSYKLSNYNLWRQQEEGLTGDNTEKITYSPYYFNYSAAANQAFNPIPFRSSVTDRQKWQNKVGSRVEKLSGVVNALNNTLQKADENYMGSLRDGLIQHIVDQINTGHTPPITNFKSFRDEVEAATLYDMQFNCCQQINRVGTAINTLQDFIGAVRDSSYAISGGTLQITHQDFDTKWATMGSYSTWRAASFIYLYPENLLMPGIKPVQTEVFQQIVDDIEQVGEFNSNTAAQINELYSSYFEDICDLNLVGVSRLTEDNWGNYNYVFGQSSKSGKLYYTVTTSTTQFDDPATTCLNSIDIRDLWKEVPNLSDYKIETFCGLSNFRQSIDKSWLYLFFTAYDKNDKLQFGFMRYDTFKGKWDEQFVPLDIAKSVQSDDLSSLSIRVVYCTNMWIRPCLAVIDQNACLFTVFTTLDGTSMEDYARTIRPFLKDTKGEKGRIILHDFVDVKSITNENSIKNAFVVVYSYLDKNQTWNLYADALGRYLPSFVLKPIPDKLSLLGTSYVGSFFSIKTISNLQHPFFNLVYKKDDGSYHYNDFQIGDFFASPGTESVFKCRATVVIAPVFNYICDGYFHCIFAQKETDKDGESFGGGIHQFIYDYTDYANAVLSKRLSPSNGSGFYKAAPQLDSNKLNDLKQASALLYSQNLDASAKVMEYIAEAFYFIPMLIAGKLQQNGYYQQALDWYRTIYNYPVYEKFRKVYFGLEAEGNVTAQYSKSELYLEDSLNPHTIALTRPDAYTRYTVASIANCILEYADSEFTEDSAQSVSRADLLYNEALKLINEFTYDAPANACDSLADTLTAKVKDAVWQPVFDTIVKQMFTIESYSDLKSAISDMNSGITANTSDYASALTVIENKINGYLQKQQGVSTITTLKQTAIDILNEGENYVMSAKANVYDNPVAWAGQGSSAAKAMTYTSTKLMDQTTSRFAQYLPGISGVSAASAMTLGTNTVSGLTDTYVPYPTGNTVALQNYNNNESYMIGDYDKAPEVVASNVPITYSQAAPAPQQTANQTVAAAPQVAYGRLNIPFTITQRISTLVYCVPSNPIFQLLKLKADVNIFKIRNCRNIAGAVREISAFNAPTDATSGLPASLNGTSVTTGSGNISALRPTRFRYSFLIDRAKTLCNIAQQMESSMLASLEKLDAENYAVFRAKQDLSLSKQQIQLQNLQVKQANDQVTVVAAQLTKVQNAINHFNDLLGNDSKLAKEQEKVWKYMNRSFDGLTTAAAINTAASATELLQNPGMAANFTAQAASNIGTMYANLANMMQTQLQWHIQVSDWEFQYKQANDDANIIDDQMTVANDQVSIAQQQLSIANLQSQNMEDNISFLQNKFTNAALYAYMSKQLQSVYKYFLGQATAAARLAATQLSFERQYDFSNTIASDYYSPPTNGQSTNADQSDLKGLTGSARLLKDIYILDNNALNTEQQKLQVTKTISLAALDPIGFQQFISTGSMSFTTTNQMFDRDFPGQYLRLINSVNVSVVALASPIDGIRATLRSLGPSRTTLFNTTAQEVVLQNLPDMAVFTSGINNGNSFELQQLTPELYKPFENRGVGTNWVFEMPLYTNRLDFNSIADVQLTINYTALYNDDLRTQVLKNLGSTFSGKRAFSVKLFYPDAWYDIFNTAVGSPVSFSFKATEDSFPINMNDFTIDGVSMYFQVTPTSDGTDFLDKVNITSLTLTPDSGSIIQSNNVVKTEENLASTAFVNGLPWIPFLGSAPTGTWAAQMENVSGQGINRLIAENRLQDIFFVIDYSATLPDYNIF